MSPADPERLARLTDQLRTLRVRLADPEADADLWEIDLYAYDDALVTVADLLDVDVPAGARDEMGSEARRTLEQALSRAGLDVWDDGEPPSGQPDPPPPAD